MKFYLLFTVLTLCACWGTGCNPEQRSGPVVQPSSAAGLDDPSIVRCESKGGQLYVTVVDAFHDAHILPLDYSETGLSKREVIARIQKNIEERKRTSNNVPEDIGTNAPNPQD